MLKKMMVVLGLLSSANLYASGFDQYNAAQQVVDSLVQNQPIKVNSVCLGVACTKLRNLDFFSKLRTTVLKNSKIDLSHLRYEGPYEVITLIGNNSNEILDFKIKESKRGPIGDRYSVYYVADVELRM